MVMATVVRQTRLRAHAVWAAQRLQLHHMLATTDPDPLVSAELAHR